MFRLALFPLRKEMDNRVETETGEPLEKRSRRKDAVLAGQPKNFDGRLEL